MKENQDKVTAKVKELAETVKAAKGSVLVIGLIEGEDKSTVIAAMQGKTVMITDAIAKLVSNNSYYAISKVLKESLALTAMYEVLGIHADKEEVEEGTNK